MTTNPKTYAQGWTDALAEAAQYYDNRAKHDLNEMARVGAELGKKIADQSGFNHGEFDMAIDKIRGGAISAQDNLANAAFLLSLKQDAERRWSPSNLAEMERLIGQGVPMDRAPKNKEIDAVDEVGLALMRDGKMAGVPIYWRNDRWERTDPWDGDRGFEPVLWWPDSGSGGE